MQKTRLFILQRITPLFIAAILTVFQPVAVFADTPEAVGPAPSAATETVEPAPAATETVAPAAAPAEPSSTPAPAPTPVAPTTAPADPTPPAPATGPTQPTGADSNKYVYNEATGLWENELYTWNPKTNLTQPKNAPTYSYNPATGRWDTTKWVYNPASGAYVPNIISVSEKPAGAKVSGSLPFQANSATTDNSGPGSNNSIDNTQNNSGIFDMFFNADISNNISSHATSGDALVDSNTTAGNAISGMAQSVANVFNLIQSSLGFLTSGLNTFVSNIFGSNHGDLTLDTSNLGPNSNTNISNQLNNNIDVNIANNGSINNTIDLTTDSGNASVTKNTNAGSATSGDATASANVVNAINSSIAANESFLGMINIYGDLNGDILLPPGVLNSLITSNALTSVDSSQIVNSNLLAEFTDNQTIKNNVNLGAMSGNSTVDSNTSAGNATTGNATSNLTILNLTGRQVIGANALLVFVNVHGSWLGMIVDAPGGSTAAALGGNLQQNTEINNNIDINAKNNNTITNNINLAAQNISNIGVSRRIA